MSMARSWAVTLGTQHMVPKAMVDANTSLMRSIRTDLRARNKEGVRDLSQKSHVFHGQELQTLLLHFEWHLQRNGNAHNHCHSEA